jgi:cellulose synthase operon protein C
MRCRVGKFSFLVLAALCLPFGLPACSDPPEPGLPLYRQAHELRLRGRESEARALYEQLLREHPGSRLGSDAHVALAELLFNAGDFDGALAHYGEVLRFTGAKTWGYALYKQGWCYLNKKDPARAKLVFERVVGLEKDSHLPDKHRADLVQQARRDLVKVYAQVGAPEGAAEYFNRWGGGDATRLLERLGALYLELEKWSAATATYRDLMAREVSSPRLCAWQSAIVRAAAGSGSAPEQVAEVQRLGAVLARVEGMQGVPAADREECRASLRDTLRELALTAHKAGQKQKDLASLELAEPLYRQYLTRFREEKDATKMTFYHAELLWSLQRWEEAGDEYRRVVEVDPKGKLGADAAYAMVLAAKNAVEQEAGHPDDRRAGAASGARSPLPLTDAERKLQAAFDLYLAGPFRSPEAVRMKFRRARLLYDKNHFADSIPLFADIVTSHREDELAIAAATLQLEALTALGRGAQAEATARELLAGPLAARDREAAAAWKKLLTSNPGAGPE